MQIIQTKPKKQQFIKTVLLSERTLTNNKYLIEDKNARDTGNTGQKSGFC